MNKANGKTVIFLGSSVTYGSAAGGVSFVDLLQEKDGIVPVKEAVSGTTLADTGSASYIARMKRLDPGIRADAFVCQLSTNDASLGIPPGSVSDTFSEEDLDASTVAGAIETIILYAKRVWNCPVVFYTNPKYPGERYERMRELLFAISEKHQTAVIDLWTALGELPEEENRRYMADPIHPTLAGYSERWLPVFEKELDAVFGAAEGVFVPAVSPSLDGAANRRILQEAIDRHGVIAVTRPGVYDIEGSLILPSDRKLLFGAGTVMRRQPESGGKNGYFIVNRGAFTSQPDENITVQGLTLCVNGVESAAAKAVDMLDELAGQGEDALNGWFDRTVIGLRGQLSFMNVRKLTVRGLTVNDLCSWDYCVHISDFDGAVLEDLHIEGNKDAVHFGAGRNFVLRNGVFRTKDDPIALNADDYAPSAPTFGSVENGLIENCVDLDQPDTFGYFVRMIVGSSVEWKKGMSVSHSEAVICGGKFYRAVLPSDGTRRISLTPPDHEKGFRILDGIPWVRTHASWKSEDLPKTADVKNITVKRLVSEKTRSVSVCLYVPDNRYRHGWREGCEIPRASGVTFEDFRVAGNTGKAFVFSAPIEELSVRNAELNGAQIVFEPAAAGIGKYPAEFSLSAVRDFRLRDAGAFTEGDGTVLPEKY